MGSKLNIVHIGKCGGSTVRSAIEQSSLISKNFKSIEITHIREVNYSKEDHYLIIIRHPIDRAISAFNWRHHLVVDTEKQRSRFRGEWEILQRYSTLSSIAENLYDAENLHLRSHVSKEFKTIHHLKEDVSFYLGKMLEHLNPAQVYGIIKQHSLTEDCHRFLGSNIAIGHQNKHGVTVDPARKVLSATAKKNLRRFLHQDFACILKLYNLGLLDWKDYELLSR